MGLACYNFFFNLRVVLIQLKYIYSFIFYFFSGVDVTRNILSCTGRQDLELKHLSHIDLSGCIKIIPNAIFEMILKLKPLKYFEPLLLERTSAEYGFSWLLRTPGKPSSQILTYVI